ncbi:hypothetical protein Tco_1254248 [Tanacetum coccineum]
MATVAIPNDSIGQRNQTALIISDGEQGKRLKVNMDIKDLHTTTNTLVFLSQQRNTTKKRTKEKGQPSFSLLGPWYRASWEAIGVLVAAEIPGRKDSLRTKALNVNFLKNT